jgi:hypothetical protein
MADIGTVRTLVLVGAILQFLFIIYYAYLILFWIPNLIYIIVPPEVAFMIPILMTMYQTLFAIFIIIGIILGILWLIWRKDAAAHRTGLIVTGVLGMLFAGGVPGLIILIAGIVAPSEKA